MFENYFITKNFFHLVEKSTEGHARGSPLRPKVPKVSKVHPFFHLFHDGEIGEKKNANLGRPIPSHSAKSDKNFVVFPPFSTCSPSKTLALLVSGIVCHWHTPWGHERKGT